jgi:preprotein translocase subunit SecG
MYAFLIVVHIIVSVIMISVILLQAGKGAEIGAAFGGSSQTIFGSRGPGTFLSRLTVAAAVIFMLTSLSLAVLSKQRSVSSAMPLPVESSAPETGPTGTPEAPGPQTGPRNPPSALVPGTPAQGKATTPAAPAAPTPAAPTPAVPTPPAPQKSAP